MTCRIASLYSFHVMSPRGKINLEAIRASLNTICTQCGYSIPPNEILRIGSYTMKRPKCSAVRAEEEGVELVHLGSRLTAF